VRRALAALILFSTLLGAPAGAQLPWLRNYYLHVGLWSEANTFTPGGLGDLQRLRFMIDRRVGPFAAELAYEHLFTYRQRAGAGVGGILAAGVAPGGGEWIDLQWTIATGEHAEWRHRFDRLSVRFAPGDVFDVTLGRQTVSWATTLLLTPADPFAPFDPADPFREYRAGVDAIRLRAFPSPLGEIELVVRPSDTQLGETLTLAARGLGVVGGWELSGWAGVLHDHAAMAFGATTELGKLAIRFEGQLRDGDGDLVARGTIGLDTRFDLFDRDLYVAFEFQRDEFGAGGADELDEVVFSDAFARGELQVLGRDVVAAQATYQLHPLVTTNLLVLVNGNDPSALMAPAVTYSVSNEVTAGAGFFLGIGQGNVTPERPVPSEFGLVPTFVYASLSVFF
jgi:hypothetical protein